MLYETPTPNNRYYTAFGVLKKFMEDNGYVISNFSLIKQAVDRVVIWCQEGYGHIVIERENEFITIPDSDKITHFICVKLSPTQFQIWGYLGNYQQCYMTTFDFADVNTPSTLNSEIPEYHN